MSAIQVEHQQCQLQMCLQFFLYRGPCLVLPQSIGHMVVTRVITGNKALTLWFSRCGEYAVRVNERGGAFWKLMETLIALITLWGGSMGVVARQCTQWNRCSLRTLGYFWMLIGTILSLQWRWKWTCFHLNGLQRRGESCFG